MGQRILVVEDDTDTARVVRAIGLTIARQLVELQGGEIGVASPAGERATFRFTLPAG